MKKRDESKFVYKYHPIVMMKANRTLNTSRTNNMKSDTFSQRLLLFTYTPHKVQIDDSVYKTDFRT